MPLFADAVEYLMEKGTHHFVNKLIGTDEKSKEAEDLRQSFLLGEQTALQQVQNSTRYFLDVRQIEQFDDDLFNVVDYPMLVHNPMFIEFNGRLKFNYRPTTLRPKFYENGETGTDISYDERDCSEYRAVLISTDPIDVQKAVGMEYIHPMNLHVHWYLDLYTTPYGQQEGDTVQVEDHLTQFDLKIYYETWPRLEMSVLEQVDELRKTPGETVEQAKRLFRMTVNLLYFISAENLTRIRIAPEYFNKFKNDLRGFPKSKKPYYIMPFQVPRYRYLHYERHNEGTKHSHQYDVKGHHRHLRNERYGKNPDGTTRVIWIEQHLRGLDNPVYLPQLVQGIVPRKILEFDEFIRDVEVAENKRRKNESTLHQPQSNWGRTRNIGSS
jgi:hypothetical protein